MSTDTLSHDAAHPDAHDIEHGGADSTYVWVAVFLAVLTAIEVALSYVKGLRPLPELALITVMIIKFATVALYFMHLKYDPKIARRVFGFGMLVAIVIYCGVLSTFHFWAPGFR